MRCLFKCASCAQQDMAKGSLGTVREGVKRAQKDLSANEYRGIDERHRKQQIEMRTIEKAANDLNEYHKVHRQSSIRRGPPHL